MLHRSLFLALALVAAGGVGAVGQPRPDLGSGAASASWPEVCVADVMKAARWFVRDLDAGTITVESGPGWRAWRGTTADEGHLLSVPWLKVEELPPSSRSSGAVSGWIEVAGAPPGMQVTALDEDTADAVLPDSHFARSIGRWRLTRSLVDGTPKEQAVVAKALDRCATALLTPPRRKPRR
jgi:hypothetical protein